MPQLSFYSAEANTPRVCDLAGLLCGPGQIVSFGGTAARLSVVVDEPWRVRAIVTACAERGVQAEPAGSDEGGGRLVRTAFRADLSALAAAWASGPVKSVPPGLVLDGALLRLWAMASGRWTDGGYLLGTEPGRSGTGEPLGGALARCGLAATMLSDRGGGPGFRVSGQRRLNRLAELVGPAPDPAAADLWPVVSRVRATG